MENDFWSFVGAVFVFFVAGVGPVSGRTSYAHVRAHRVPCDQPGVSGGFTLFEGWSFAIGFPENKQMIRGRDVPYGASSSHSDRDCKTQGHLRGTLTMEILTYVAPGMVPLIFMGLTSSIREPALQRFMVL
jgi:hypothetical protein